MERIHERNSLKFYYDLFDNALPHYDNLHIVLDPLIEEGGAYIELCIARWAESVTP